MGYNPERRRTYVQLKEALKGFAGLFTQQHRGEPVTCRVSINIGLELVLAGLDLLRAHGVDKVALLAFIEGAYGIKGDLSEHEMRKGGKEEGLLREAMRLINGRIVRRANDGSSIEGATDSFIHDLVVTLPDVSEHEDDKPVDRKKINSDPRFN